METLTLLRRLAEQHSYATLREACHDADRVAGEDVRVLAALAEAALGNGRGARLVLASLDRNALDIDARVDVAAVHVALGEVDVAAEILERDLEEHPDHALLLARLGWCRLKQGRREQALALNERSLRSRPCMAVYHNLLQLHRECGRLSDLADCLDAAWTFWVEHEHDWPDVERNGHTRALRRTQLDLWLLRDQFAIAEQWIANHKEALGEEDWCALLCDFAELLVSRDRHPQAEDWLRVGLRRYPDAVALWSQLAELTHQQGRTANATALLRRAIRLSESRNEATSALWLRLATIAREIDPVGARDAVERARADESVEGQLRVELALADIDTEESKYEVAEQRYRRALEQRPDALAALQGMGRLCMELGRIDEAVTLFERVSRMDPLRGSSALIDARRFPQDAAALHRLEALARRPGVDAGARTSLLFRLAAAWEARDEFDRAFELADEANTASRRLLTYDAEAHRQRCARIRHAFPKALYAHRAGCGHESTLPVFVVGMPRSGTTLVEQIIAGHSRIHGAGELGTIPRVIAGLERWERQTGSGRRYPDCVDDLDPRVTRGIAESVLAELREIAPGAAHVVDKLPHNFENVGLIRLLFPRAKIISVRRDPRDVGISNYFIDFRAKHRGMGFAYDLGWIGEQLADHDRLMRHWEDVFPGDILEVRYEDVIDDPERSARRMLDYLGVKWEPRVLDFHALERPLKTASLWHVRQPLYTHARGRWRHYEARLQPLLAAIAAPAPVEKIRMATLPEPGWLNGGVDYYRRGDLDAAEYRFKQLLHYVPEHAAARFMLGVIYMHKGHREDAVELMEQAVARCPWNHRWRRDLGRAYRLAGRCTDLVDGADERTEGSDEQFISRELTCTSAVTTDPR